jgi:CubicO group peptidase (beta-lactamase class C family)
VDIVADDTMMEGEQGEKLKTLEPLDSPQELMEYMASLDIRLLGYPGEYFSYSNDCYGLLGEIIARVSGLSYEDYVSENIFQPLGMTRSTFSTATVQEMDNVATLYSYRHVDKRGRVKVFRAPVWGQAPAMTACGFMKSTLRDMMRYAEIFATGGTSNGNRILSDKSVDQNVRTLRGNAYRRVLRLRSHDPPELQRCLLG